MGTQRCECAFEKLCTQVRACQLCETHLPLGPRPVFQAHPAARILIAAQAPGTRVHETGIPFNDPSGDRLRQWMGIDRDVFYDELRIALLPMGFCYPGRGKSGDLPPREECAPAWRKSLLDHLPDIRLTLVMGQYAHGWHLPEPAYQNLTERVRAWRTFGDGIMPLPHPSPRNNLWLRRNPWFEEELVPALRERVQQIIGR
ncbi:MAG: uracil-DNA glycosylase family protein [Pseudomonadales bacterium]|jgi:uracil-DNA glycosylase|nr:uracil-DNA glycosylase family protein [Pseudomonadales bacterium]MDP6472520.1 uracil-DNA glycosylase family protein [Pseudomonadales bacterium]MDP6828669.1 uracil-DNA glycosylase family protein [Pseudomonadales bacterium]MDP6971989.1 uracil-DNA glycosylase family protein [Pseudomonadales bacterium]|tara:strand:- start:482 stop:1084 length:603 start_codon:yes stop_codon:yes gene_type:complete